MVVSYRLVHMGCLRKAKHMIFLYTMNYNLNSDCLPFKEAYSFIEFHYTFICDLSVYHMSAILHPVPPVYSHMQKCESLCVWLCLLGYEDGWGRKHKLQAGLVLALSPTVLIYSEAHHHSQARLQFIVHIKHNYVHTMAHKY